LLVIGERINTSRKDIAPAVAARDVAFIQGEAKKQVEAGAAMVDVNAGTFLKEEPEVLSWLVKVVQEAVDVPLCIDTPNPVALQAALKHHRGKAMVNSITGEKARFKEMVSVIKEFGASVVALCMDDKGMPETAEQAIEVGSRLIEELLKEGIDQDDIYVDPLVRPVSTDNKAGLRVLETIHGIKSRFPSVHVICGLSNVSYGLPQRKLLNQAFLVSTMTAGLDAVILDPLDRQLMGLLYAAKVLLGRDEYCGDYLKAYREGRLG